jgi:hypothetical protein
MHRSTILKSGGNANYNALQLSLQHRLTHGLSLITNYTYSKSLGDSSSANLGSQNNDAFRYTYTPNIEYGPLDFDVRNRFVTSFIYQLPFGQGERFGRGKQFAGGSCDRALDSLGPGDPILRYLVHGDGWQRQFCKFRRTTKTGFCSRPKGNRQAMCCGNVL